MVLEQVIALTHHRAESSTFIYWLSRRKTQLTSEHIYLPSKENGPIRGKMNCNSTTNECQTHTNTVFPAANSIRKQKQTNRKPKIKWKKIRIFDVFDRENMISFFSASFVFVPVPAAGANKMVRSLSWLPRTVQAHDTSEYINGIWILYLYTRHTIQIILSNGRKVRILRYVACCDDIIPNNKHRTIECMLLIQVVMDTYCYCSTQCVVHIATIFGEFGMRNQKLKLQIQHSKRSYGLRVPRSWEFSAN